MATRKVRLLVLDDEPWNMSWLEDFIAAENAEVQIVTSYDDAVRAIATAPPDIAIVDIMVGAVAGEPIGATLSGVPAEWVGLRLVRHIRVELSLPKEKTAIIVYTVLDRAELAKVAREAFQAEYCVKSEVAHFRSRLTSLIGAFAKKV